LKSAMLIFSKLNALERLKQKAQIAFEDCAQATQILEPSGSKSPGFHIYSDYSDLLKEIRSEKRELERKIAKAKAADRPNLMRQRSLLVSRENNEEDRIRQELGTALQAHLRMLKANARACALLDFRLAKAELAIKWKACQPTLVADEQPADLKEAIHPIIAQKLENQGSQFSPQSIRLEPGSTVISGANMAGKSVALQTIFINLLITQMGYFPVCQALSTPLFDFFTFDSSQSGELNKGLSSFGLESVKIRNHYRYSQGRRGLIIMDEPARGTNPAEARAIVQTLCEAYGLSASMFLIATHYQVHPAKGIRFYQIRGIRPEDLQQLPAWQAESVPVKAQKDGDYAKEDLERVRFIQNLMDYRLSEVSAHTDVPSGAIRVAELLGMDEELIRNMKTIWKKDQTINGKS
jgi:DNA mismatch repair protein MutS2